MTTTVPIQTRIDWPRAWRAVNALRANTDDIQHAFEVMIALDGGQMEAMYQREHVARDHEPTITLVG